MVSLLAAYYPPWEEIFELSRTISPVLFIVLVIAFPVRVSMGVKNWFSHDPVVRNRILNPLNSLEGLLLTMMGTGGYLGAWLVLAVWYLVYRTRLWWRRRKNEQAN